VTRPTERLLELLSLLQSGRDWPSAELVSRLGTTPRTLRRDLERLRDLGYPVESRRGPGGAYRLVAGRAVPPLMFTDDEAVAAAVALRAAGDDAAVSAMRKLEQALPARLRYRLEAISTAVSDTTSTLSPTVVATVATAARAHQHLRLRYRDRAGTRSTRRVEPYRQVLLGHRWYLHGWDQDRSAWRSFRLDRISSVEVPGTTFTPRADPPARRSPFTTDGPDVAEVHFDAPAHVVAEGLRAEAGTLTATSDHTCRYTTGSDQWRWLAGTLAAVGVPYRVLRPPELVDQTRRLADRVAAAAPEPGGPR